MSTFEVILYAIFFTAVFIVSIAIYFYNTRHSETVTEKRFKKVKHEKKKDRVVEFKKNDRFDWDVYEDDLSIDDKKFFGFDIWEKREKALNRIEQLKRDYEHDKHSIEFNMIEMLMLVHSYGEFLKINDKGEYVINKLYIRNFIEGRKYDVNTIIMIDGFKDNLMHASKDIQLDPKKAFYILKNAKSFGLNNVKDDSQFFRFINRAQTNLVVDDNSFEFDHTGKIEIVITENEISTIDFDIDNANAGSFIKGQEKVFEENPKELLSRLYKEYTKDFIVEKTAQGYTKITYPDGSYVVKNGPWDVIEMKTIEEIKKEEAEKDEQKRKADEIAAKKNNNKIMAELSQDIDSKKDILTKVAEEKNKDPKPKTKDEKFEIKEEVHKEKEDQESSVVKVKPIKPLDEQIIRNDSSTTSTESKYLTPIRNRNLYLTGNGREKSFYNYFENVKTENDFAKAFSTLTKVDILMLIRILLDEDLYVIDHVEKDGKGRRLQLFYTDGKYYYLSYEYVIYILLNLSSNKDSLIEASVQSIKGFSMSYPSVYVSTLVSHSKRVANIDLFATTDGKNFFNRTFQLEDKLYKMNLLSFDKAITDHLLANEKSLMRKARKIKLFTSEELVEFKKEIGLAVNISLSNFKRKENI